MQASKSRQHGSPMGGGLVVDVVDAIHQLQEVVPGKAHGEGTAAFLGRRKELNTQQIQIKYVSCGKSIA